MTVTTVVAIRRAILLVCIIKYDICGRFMYMLSNNFVLVIGLVKLVRVSDCCK
ncbi:MAG: hypothetical protein ACJA2K_002196 [Thalassolituus sp.]|jgi:hypothetical protein|tara:strand:+ start:653 stop:811 length:159 start_codon:yes stop_codon:yes gene_type:complete